MGVTTGRRRRGPDDAGMSLLEVVIAMAIFSIGVTAVLGLLIRTDQVASGNLRRSTAAGLVDQYLEAARAQAALDLTNGRNIDLPKVNGIEYKVTTNVSVLTSDATSSACTTAAGSARLAYKLVRVAVTWPDMGLVQPVTGDLLRAIGPGAIDSTKNSLAVQLSDANGKPVAGVTVALNGGTTTQTTGDDGCAVFTGLADGAYSATANQAGYVGTANTQSAPSRTVNVTATQSSTGNGAAVGTLSKVDLPYDTARSLTYTYASPMSGVTALASGIPLRISRSGLTETTVSATCASSSTSMCLTTTTPPQIQALYPGTYTVKAGSCTPAGPSQGQVNIQDAAASGGAVSIPMGALTIQVKGLLGSSSRLVTITPSSSCPAGDSYTVNVPAAGTTVLVPYGSYVLTATGVTVSSSATVSSGSPVQSVVVGAVV
ncbi:prepilin-type N-terminal cleavage/methylation domain-containing protein [Kineosporia succinea]|uniref:alpha-amylase n=1 Tax=Kineosporia succinea TaxID=84632 RepID=A0ABT9NVG2_9ACTN|nr:prepilin-type N-terminal cleavage/methylation domain-containing protein [Kineosporia succinea]MDP9824311.1 prepilin-type N-terminal cleavage/methylation domain-containing protein [Kineosporia succinea]